MRLHGEKGSVCYDGKMLVSAVREADISLYGLNT